MMLEWLGKARNDSKLVRAANILERSVEAVLSDGKVLTPDLGGSATCGMFVEAVKSKIAAFL
jgi:3-isopropylmalate dehydrogenase